MRHKDDYLTILECSLKFQSDILVSLIFCFFSQLTLAGL